MGMTSINPATGKVIRAYQTLDAGQLQDAIALAQQSFDGWSKTSLASRGACMVAASSVLRQCCEELAILMADEMGKPIRDGRLEVVKCADACDYFAEQAERFLQPQRVTLPDKKCTISYQPLGVVLAVMPWNFPFWQVFRFLAPTLMAGNVALLKHASNVPGCALAIAEVLREAGFPQGVMQSLLIGSDAVKTVIEHPGVAAVTLTGSTKAGENVAATAGGCVKKSVLELGGSDPYIILDDADLQQAVPICVQSRLTNSGQSCIAAKRFIVVEALRAEFEKLFVEKMREVVVGDPRDGATQVGPLARVDLRDALHDQVQRSIAKGAQCLLGGEIPAGEGAYYSPTVLSNVKAGMAAYEEELFGPVAAIIPVKDQAEAIRVANDTIYGLGAALFTRDVARGEAIATQEIHAGSIAINALVKSDVHLPFGGVKSSGYGRELSEVGIKEFVNIKVVGVANS